MQTYAQMSDPYNNRSCSLSKEVCFVGQGYGAVKGIVGEVEVWGLGGARADEDQAKYQHRENMFSEQRRKVCEQSWDSNSTQRDQIVKTLAE